MKIKLAFDWLDFGQLYPAGTIVDVSDRDGEMLIADGHEKVHPDTRSTRNTMYYIGCIPPPFNPENAVLTSDMFGKENDQTEQQTNTKNK